MADATSSGPAVASPAAGPDPTPRTVIGGCPRCLGADHQRCLRFFPYGPAMAHCRCWCRTRRARHTLRSLR